MKDKTGRVEIGISEPWDAGYISCTGFAGKRATYTCKYYGNTVNCLLVELDKPLNCKNQEWSFLVCSPRHEGFKINDIWSKCDISFGMIGIDEFDANSEYWFDNSQWRGDPPAFIGTIRGESSWWRRL